MARTSGYAGGTYAFELGGDGVGFPDSVEGGAATADVVVEKDLGPDFITHKHLAGVKYEDITVNCGAGMSNDFYDWLKGTFDRTNQRKNGAIVEYDFQYNEVSRLNFSNAFITEICFPTLDGAARDAGTMTIKLTPESTSRAASKSGQATKYANSKGVSKKNWLLSNFQLTIDGLDCTHVNRVDAITVKQMVIENAVGQLRDYERVPGSLEVSNVAVTLAESQAQDFYDWHEDFVIRGNSGQSKEKGGTLAYLAPNLKDVLFTLTFTNLGIFKLTSQGASSEVIRRVTAQMYCEVIGFKYGAAVTSSAVGSTTTADATGGKQSQGKLPAPPAVVGVKRALTDRAAELKDIQGTAIAPQEQAPRPSFRFRT